MTTPSSSISSHGGDSTRNGLPSWKLIPLKVECSSLISDVIFVVGEWTNMSGPSVISLWSYKRLDDIESFTSPILSQSSSSSLLSSQLDKGNDNKQISNILDYVIKRSLTSTIVMNVVDYSMEKFVIGKDYNLAFFSFPFYASSKLMDINKAKKDELSIYSFIIIVPYEKYEDVWQYRSLINWISQEFIIQFRICLLKNTCHYYLYNNAWKLFRKFHDTIHVIQTSIFLRSSQNFTLDMLLKKNEDDEQLKENDTKFLAELILAAIDHFPRVIIFGRCTKSTSAIVNLFELLWSHRKLITILYTRNIQHLIPLIASKTTFSVAYIHETTSQNVLNELPIDIFQSIHHPTLYVDIINNKIFTSFRQQMRHIENLNHKIKYLVNILKDKYIESLDLSYLKTRFHYIPSHQYVHHLLDPISYRNDERLKDLIDFLHYSTSNDSQCWNLKNYCENISKVPIDHQFQ
ncbi:hypothetical protein SNEBB_010614 [Seison nebaliae]|nr:hypothetical protein SNEBB_010614 [Seison nebaliae]